MKLNRRDVLKLTAAGLLAPEVLPQTPCVWAEEGAGKKAFSLHIGLDDIDTSKYSPGVPPLHGCIQDAKTYKSMIEELDKQKIFQSKILLSNDPAVERRPTCKEVQRHIYWAAQLLKKGDLFVITYAGHGGSLPDNDGDEVDDKRDETWCLYDRQLRDDELYRMWAQFDEGVRLLVISDSCHSGTVAREAFAQQETQRMIGELKKTISDNQALGKSEQAMLRGFGFDDAAMKTPNSPANLKKLDTIAARGSRGFARGAVSRDLAPPPGGDFEFRALPREIADKDYESRKTIYDNDAPRQGPGDTNGRGQVAASGLLLAGCQDNQFSMESNGQGLFTRTLRGLFQSANNYHELLNRAAANMPSTQRPNFFTFGAENGDFTEKEKPFTV